VYDAHQNGPQAERIQQVHGLISVNERCVMQLMFMWYMESEWKGFFVHEYRFPLTSPMRLSETVIEYRK